MSLSFMATVTIFFLRFDRILPVSKTFFVSLHPLFATVQILGKLVFFQYGPVFSISLRIHCDVSVKYIFICVIKLKLIVTCSISVN